ncbi:MAG TPA: hypothetical protein VGA37_08280 [Gemmatimonadales bacterium]
MFAKLKLVTILVALSAVWAPRLFADPTSCSENAIGGQTGNEYELVGESLVTVTTTTTIRRGISLIWGLITLSGYEEETTTTSVTYYEGTYSDGNGNTVTVNCSTGQVT